MDITFTIEDIKPCEKKVNLNISASKVRNELKRTVDSYKNQAKISGFRNGNAPRSVIMKKYGDQIIDSVQKNLIDIAQKFFFKENKNLIPILEVESEIKKIEEGQNYNFSITYEIRPEFKLPKYKGLKLETSKIEINDTIINERIKEILKDQATLSVINDIVKDEDFVKCNVKCLDTLDEEIANSINGENRWVIMSDGGQFPGAKNLLLGKKSGDKVCDNISFPIDYSFNDELKNKTLKFEFIITEVQRRKIPELDAEFIKKNKLESIEKFKENLAQKLKEELKNKREGYFTDKIIEQLLAEIDYKLPTRTLERQTKNVIQEMLHEKEQHQHEEKCNHNIDAADEAMKKTAKDKAEKVLKTSFLIDKIAEIENIKVEKNDLLERLQKIAQMYNMELNDLIKNLSDRNELMQLQIQIKHEKTIKKIIELAEIFEA